MENGNKGNTEFPVLAPEKRLKVGDDIFIRMRRWNQGVNHKFDLLLTTCATAKFGNMAMMKGAATVALLLGSASAYYHERRQVGSDAPAVVIPGASSYNGLNLVPQMGWNNWNAFHCDVNESLLLTTAQDMVDFGLRDLGYNYIVLDDCWSVGRNESGYLVADCKFRCGNTRRSC